MSGSKTATEEIHHAPRFEGSRTRDLMARGRADISQEIPPPEHRTASGGGDAHP